TTRRRSRTPRGRSRTGGVPSRRKALRRRWGVLVGLVSVLVLAYVLMFTPLLGVNTVRVEGSDQVSAARIREKAAVEQGTPLLRVDTAAVQGRVTTLTQLAGAEVTRSWPSTIVVSVTERVPVAAVEVSQGFRLVDRHGVAYRTVDDKSAELPVVLSNDVAVNDQRLEAVAKVLAELPTQLRKRVSTASADSAHTVRFTLGDDTEVIWGDAARSERKARVLAALLTREGTVYDVSSPELPTVR